MRKCIILENKTRCSWANQNEMIKKYHDMEWGSPCHDNHKLFELLSLEVFQSGLNWNLILKKEMLLKKHLIILILTLFVTIIVQKSINFLRTKKLYETVEKL